MLLLMQQQLWHSVELMASLAASLPLHLMKFEAQPLCMVLRNRISTK